MEQYIISYSPTVVAEKLGHAEFLLLAQSKHDGDVTSHELQNRVGEEGSDGTDHASLGALAGGIAQSIDNSRDGPAGADGGSGDGVAQAGNQESSKERGLVLGEVGVGTLGAVELIGLGVLIGLLVTGVRDGILEAAGLAVLAGELDVEGVDEEGGCRNHEDEAVLVGELESERHRGRLFV